MPVTCPRCGREGFVEKKRAKGREYVYVRHEDKHICFIGQFFSDIKYVT
jgi:hypothetical protein